jgi:hypothetical protein
MTMKTAAHTAGAVEGAVDARLAAAALWALNGPGPLDVRTGVVYAPGNPMQVLGTSATSPWAVTVNPGHVVGSKGVTNGPYYGANDGLTTVNLTVPPASNSRIDVIYAMQQDAAAILNADESTAAVLNEVIGVPGAIPAVPAVPVGAVALYTVQIASTATAGTSGAGVTITPVFNWTTTRNDPIPVRNVTERAAISQSSGAQVQRLDTGIVERSDGTTWRSAGSFATYDTTTTTAADGTFSGTFPAGLFTVAPLCFATVQSGTQFAVVAVAATSPTTFGGHAGYFPGGSGGMSLIAGFTVAIHAVQATSTSAAG